jgi:hypothetical protein
LIALKFPATDRYAEAGSVTELLKEARAAAALHHPNIVTVYEVGEFKAHPFIAMSYVAGPTLSRLMTQKKIPVDMIVDLGIQIAGGLVAAHEKGIVHRDLKPGNIILDQTHSPCILDFGLSVSPHAATSDTDDTVTIGDGRAVMAGTLSYMAPEQLTNGKITPLVDVFALGIILYELVYGIHPFKGNSVEDLYRNLLQEAPPEFLDTKDSVPYDLVRIIRRCLQKDPEYRFQTAKDVRNELLELQRQMIKGDVLRWDGQASGGERSLLSQERFSLSADLVRQLQVQSPKMIGDHIVYLDNGVISDTLVIYLHAWGLDYRQSADFLSELPVRGVTPTLYGFGQHTKHRPPLTLNDHSTLLRALFKRLDEVISPKYVILSGHSSGADQVMHIATSNQHPGLEIAGLLLFGCNLHLGSCFMSARFANLKHSSPEELLSEIKQIGSNTRSLSEWVKFHEYMVMVFSKFGDNADALRALGADIVKPFRENDWRQFATWYRNVMTRYQHVRFVVDLDDSEILDKILEYHLKENVLGDDFKEGTIVRENVPHIELHRSDILLKHTIELIDEIKAG